MLRSAVAVRAPRGTSVALLGAALTLCLAPLTPASADTGGTTYAAPSQLCQITDDRLGGISGATAIGGRINVINDRGPATIYSIDSLCRVTSARPIKITYTDAEDLAATPDGAFWIADIGGNRVRRQVVSLYRWPGSGTAAERFDLRYPDGAHDAEALLISLAGQVVVVTKASNGRSEVYAINLPLAKTNQLQKVADLNVAAIRRPGDTAPGSLLITGGAVSLNGVNFVLRTYTAAYEWDAPDGDVAASLARRKPRAIPLAKTSQGEAITYSEDGSRLLTGTEGLPAPMHAVAVTRGEPAPAGAQGAAESSSVRITPGVAFGAAASALLIAGIAVLGWRQRRLSARVTTYQSTG